MPGSTCLMFSMGMYSLSSFSLPLALRHLKQKSEKAIISLSILRSFVYDYVPSKETNIKPSTPSLFLKATLPKLSGNTVKF